MAPRTFTASVASDVDEAPVPFDLNGVYRKAEPDGTHRTWTESFLANKNPDAAVANSLRNAILIDQRGRQGVNPAATIDFIQKCLVPESAERFMSLINDDDRFVRMELLGDVFTWLSEDVVTGRPTVPSLPSSDGTTATAPGLLDSSPAPVSPPQP